METFTVFIVEDDPWYGQILAYHLSLNPEYQVLHFASGKECLANLHKKPDLITIDYSLPDTTGDALFRSIRSVNQDMPVIIISGQEDVGTAIDMLKMGVTDYLVKNDNTKDHLWNALTKIRETQTLKKEVATLKIELGQKYEFENIIMGTSPCMKKIFALMEKAAKTNINVSITGETGTGKELVAKAIHYHSERKKQPFVAVNMAAIPSELLESELFGYEKGAFTGAISRKIGKFEEAHKGTLFLDEIAELDASVQSKLLRVLQERELTRVGGTEKVTLDVRLVVATHSNLLDEIKKGSFREDLYYRVMGLPIDLPPLRERGNDILVLAKHLLNNFCTENKTQSRQLSAEARQKLIKYKFPGNVRELKSMIELSAVMSDQEEIAAEDISFPALKSSDFNLTDEKTLKDYNLDIVKHFLEKYHNNVCCVAEKLAIGKSTIYKMIQQKEISF